MHHDPDYCRGIALVLKGESLKAKRCVSHNASLGVLRERMVARFVRDATPDQMKVETGLIYSRTQDLTSRQCDLLVHNATGFATLYRWGDFVIVEPDAAQIVIEVKSELNQVAFESTCDIQASVSALKATRGCIPVFCYALEGVTFETFLGYIAKTLQEANSILAVPHCVAVQSRQYFAVRPVNKPAGDFCVYAVNIGDKPGNDDNVDGLETGLFLEVYKRTACGYHEPFQGRTLEEWFKRIRSGYSCASVDLKGKIQHFQPEAPARS